MSIIDTLNQEEQLSNEQQENITGGMEANTNDAWFCSCSGTGDNENTSIGCVCKDDESPEE